MNRTIRILLLSLVAFSCAQPDGHKASDADWRQWQSYLERAENHPDSAMILADSALMFARSNGMSDTGFYRPWELKSTAERSAENFKEAKSWLDSVQMHASDARHYGVEVRALNNIGLLLLQTPDWKMAEVPFRDALDLVEDPMLTAEKPYTLFFWASFLRRSGNFSGALDTLELVEPLFRAAGNRKYVGNTYFLRGDLLSQKNDVKGAEACYRTALTDFEAIGDRASMSRPYRRLSSLLLPINADSARHYFRASVAADPTHQFSNVYLSGLMQFARFDLEGRRPDNALPLIDSAISFTTTNKNQSGLWNAWVLKGVAYLQKSDTTLSDSAFRKSLTISLDNGQFNEFTWVLSEWQEKFSKQGLSKAASRMAMWSDPRRLSARNDFQVVQPKQVLELPASRKAAIQKRQRIKIAIWAGSLLLIFLIVRRLNFIRRNNAFTLYRERAAALAASRSYRRDAISNAESNISADGTQLVIERERRVLAMEALFEQEKLHLDPDLSFSTVCEHLKESEPAFRNIVKKMYDVDFEQWLTEYRIEAAILQLNAGADLSTIHSSCGFRDATTFRKTFEKVTGLKPGSYLKWPKPAIR